MSIIRQYSWNEQPQLSLEIDWSNPLTRGLVRLVVPINGVDLFDCVNKEFATRVGTSFAPDFTVFGAAAKTTAVSGSYWTLPVKSETRNNLSVGRIGVIYPGGQTLAMRDATAAGGTILHWSNGGWDMRIGGTDYAAAGTHATGTTYISLVTSSPTAGKTFVRGQGLVINGGAPGASSLVSPWQIHHNSGGTTSIAGLTLLPIWDRALSDSEATAWIENPWQLFTPQKQKIFVSINSGNYTITADNGSYSVTGQSASIYKSKVVVAAQGSYSLTGQNATITYTPSGTNYTIVANHGTYNITGQAASILRSKQITAAHGTYTLTGQNATVAYSGSNTITLKAGSWIRYRIIT